MMPNGLCGGTALEMADNSKINFIEAMHLDADLWSRLASAMIVGAMGNSTMLRNFCEASWTCCMQS